MSADKIEKAREFYRKFEAIHNQAYSGLVRALSKPFVEPEVYFERTGIIRMSYSKLVTDLTYYLASRGANLGDDFRDKLFYSFRPSEKGGRPVRHALTDMEFGRIWGDPAPDIVFRQFDDIWMACYLLAGMGASHFGDYKTGYRLTKSELRAWDTPHIIAWTINRGIKRLNHCEKQLGKTLPHREDIEAIVEYTLNPERDQLNLNLVL